MKEEEAEQREDEIAKTRRKEKKKGGDASRDACVWICACEGVGVCVCASPLGDWKTDARGLMSEMKFIMALRGSERPTRFSPS